MSVFDAFSGVLPSITATQLNGDEEIWFSAHIS
jgi:hypothetical protein